MQTLQILLCAVSSLLFVFLSSSVQIPFDGCPEIHMHHPSHLRNKPQPLETNRPITRANYVTTRKRTRKKKKKYEKIRTTLVRLLPVKSSTDPNCMFVSVFQHCNLHINNTEHSTICLLFVTITSYKN